ncbi:MAG: hypothetical protein H6807_00830 [Planctomycetes bacterium]|nr:hypothetical protein [Planctomycetota bacterium]
MLDRDRRGRFDRGMRSPIPGILLLLLASALTAQVEEVDAADIDARLGLLLDEYLLSADDDRARAIEKEIDGLPEVDLERVLARLRAPMSRPPRPAGVRRLELPLGGEGRRYVGFVAVPEGYDPGRSWPLFLTAHGTGGDAEGPLQTMMPHAARAGMLVASLQECPERRAEGWGYSAEERRVQEEFILAIRRDYQIDSRRIYMIGWSRGGHASWDLALRRPGLLAGIGPIVGGVPARDLALLPNLLGTRIDAVNGGRDQPELVQAVSDAATRLRELGVDYRGLIDPERGHDVFLDRLAPMVEHLGAQVRPLAPGRIAIASWEKDLCRHDWLAIAGFEAKLYKPGARITIPGVAKMGAEERRRAWLEAVEAGTARLEAEVLDQNKIRITAHKVKRVKIFLPPTGIDLAQPVEILLGEKSLRKSRIKGSIRDLLRSARAARDPFMAYPASVELSLP